MNEARPADRRARPILAPFPARSRHKLLHSRPESALGHLYAPLPIWPERAANPRRNSPSMARRFSAPYQSEPFSGLATWARNLAVFSVIAVAVSILIVRFGFLEMKPALATFFGALGLAAVSILIGLLGFAAIWQNGTRGMSRILLAFVIDAVVLAYPAYLAFQYRRLPPIHDITTDPIDPPRFEALGRLRTGDGANTAVYAGL